MSIHGSTVKALDLFYPANLAAIPADTHMSHWWHQQQHPATIAPVPLHTWAHPSHHNIKRPQIIS